MKSIPLCKECEHAVELHKENGCKYVISVSDDGKQKKHCGCNKQ